jgi:beta-galactosidase
MRYINAICCYCIVSFFTTIITVNASNPAPLSDSYNGERGASFNDGWKFYLGDASGANAKVFNDAAWRNLSVPHDWSIEFPFNQNSAAGGGGGYLDGGTGWYRKSFTLPQAYSGKRITIQFEGIYMNSEVWINGHSLGVRPYGYSSFEYDLTPYLNFGSTTNVIAVKVNNNQPNSRWYSGSGIYRNVWLTVTGPVHIAYCGTFATTSAISQSSATVSISCRVQNHSTSNQQVSVVSTIYDKSGNALVKTQSNASNILSSGENIFNSTLNIVKPVLWSTSNPYLYTLKTQVYIGNLCVDNYVSKLGVRYFSVDANNGFSLNGVTTKLHGVCMHHDLGSLGAAQNYRALERQVEVLKSFGCNAIRTSHNPPAPALLEICDRLGLVVMDEVFDCWRQGKNSNDYHLYFDTWAQQDVQDWVRRDRNHPSVIMWSIGNEIPEQWNTDGIAIANNLITWVKNDDTSRPITQALNNQGVLGDLLTIVGYNYAGSGTYDNDHKNHPAWRIMGSETSSAVRTRGVYHLPVAQNILTAADMQCSSYDNSVVPWGHSAENSWMFDRDRPFVLGQFIWTGFDYIGEPTPYGWPAKSSYFGIVDLAGFPKDIYYFYQSQWTSTPMVHLLPHWNWPVGQTIPVWAYTNCDSVKLTINGKQLGTRNFKAGGVHLAWDVPFEPGTIQALAYKGGSIAAMDSVKTSSIPSVIKLKSDRDTIQGDGRDLAFIETDIVDGAGNIVPDASNEVSYSITGPGKIVGVDNGNPISIEPFKALKRMAYNGKCLAIVQSTGTEGQIVVTATTPPVQKNIALGKTSNADSEDVYVLTNVASGKTSGADSEENGNGASNGNDGNTGTRWCAPDGNVNHWWKVDLGSNIILTGSKVTWEHNGNAYQYKIEASTDNNSWTVVTDKTSNTNTQQTQVDDFSVTARYVRITVTGGVNYGNWASFYEFQLFDGSSVKTTNGNTANKGNDGDLNSIWRAADGNTGHWWNVGLGANYNLKGTQITWENSGNAYQYKIEVSTDSINWLLTADKTSNTTALQVQDDSFTATCRYVRVTVTGGVNSANKASIKEFKVFDDSYTTFAPSSVIINAVNKPWINVNSSGWQQTGSVNICQGSSVTLRPMAADTINSWSWTGPNNFAVSLPVIRLNNIQPSQSGTYTATLNEISYNFQITVNAVSDIIFQADINNAGLKQVDSLVVNKGDAVLLSPQQADGSSWIWNSTNGFAATLKNIQLNSAQLSDAGTYTLQCISSGCALTKDIKLVVKDGTGFSKDLSSHNFEIYPNPVINGRFYVRITDDLKGSAGILSFYDVFGQKKKEVLIHDLLSGTMDASELGLTAGIYFVNYKSDRLEATKKLVIQ